ncbi:MAG: thioredoxin family protein [Opitutus sp.]
MRKLILHLLMISNLTGFTAIRAADAPNDVEQQVSALIAAPEITIVHLWAPWCSSCQTEMRPDGWAKFIAEHPDVKVVFVNVWHQGLPPERMLKGGGLGAQKNFVAFNHPNPASSGEGRLQRFLGLSISWTPTTWVYREGKLRYALNYGEIRFPMLEQMVKDAGSNW